MAKTNDKSTSAEADLASAVTELTQEVAVLRMATDELREEVQWNNHNSRTEMPPLTERRIQSCSLDPTARDFEVNTVDAATVERLRSELGHSKATPGKQGELFS